LGSTANFAETKTGSPLKKLPPLSPFEKGFSPGGTNGRDIEGFIIDSCLRRNDKCDLSEPQGDPSLRSGRGYELYFVVRIKARLF
jgi:hypothetical protein